MTSEHILHVQGFAAGAWPLVAKFYHKINQEGK